MTEVRAGRVARRRGGMLIVAATIASVAGSATAQMRVVNYNVAQMRGDDAALADVFAALDVDDKPGFSTPVAVYVFQEVRNADVDDLFAALPPDFALATYTNQGEDFTAGAQALFYRVTMLAEDPSAHLDIFTGAGRRADRWKLQLVGYDSPDAAFYVYGMHLKAGNDFGDAQEREDGVDAIRLDAATLPAGTNIIYTGDMNFDANTEGGYQAFIDLGPFPGQGLDALGTGSWFGAANAIKHTQSPCDGNCLPDLISGAMDDRFDFQFVTEELMDAEGLAMITGTYRAFGNDADHYDLAINDGTNSYYPDDIPRSNALADDLHDASDHIPVVVDYQIPPVMGGLVTPDFGRVIEGGAVDVIYFVTNDVDVDAAIGGATLNFIASGGDGLSGTDVGSVPALGAFFNSTMTVDTTTAAVVDGTVNLVSLDEGVQNPVLTLHSTGTVLRPSNPSFEAGVDVDAVTVDRSYDADSGVQTIDVEVYNFAFDPLQSLLDVDAAGGASDPFAFVGGLAAGLGAEAATLTFSFDTAGLAGGLYEETVTIDTSDEDVPGETMVSLALTLSVTVDDKGAGCAPDFDGNGAVDVVDLLALLAVWGSCDPCVEDLDGDGFVNVVDLLALLAEWGTCS